jgi:DtxR family Mn-dependent transcriptional regulator
MASLTQSEEDYLEAIYVVKQEKKVVRTKDVAKHLNIKLPSVTEAIKKLSKKGLTVYEKYGYIQLTKKGEKHAKSVFKKHEILFAFLTKILGVKKETALRDCCLIEHSLSAETLEKLISFVKKNK